jgi:hypothetical protein
MVDVQTISIVIASAGVLAAATYYVLQIRHQTRIRKTDLFVRLWSTSTSNEFMDAFWKINNLQVKDYSNYVKQHGPLSNLENPVNRAFFLVGYYYDLAGTLLFRKLIDLVTVYDVWGSSNPIRLFENIKPIVYGIRREFGEPLAFCGFEYLCDELRRKEPQLRKTWGEHLSQISMNIQQGSVKNG